MAAIKKTHRAQQKERVAKEIKKAMLDSDLSAKDLSKLMGFKNAALLYNRNKNPGMWKLDELLRLIDILHLTPEQQLIIMGGKGETA